MSKVRIGDIFAMPLECADYAFGQVVAHRAPIYYMIAYEIKAPIQSFPDLNAIISSPIE